jgi:hypothetical protein
VKYKNREEKMEKENEKVGKYLKNKQIKEQKLNLQRHVAEHKSIPQGIKQAFPAWVSLEPEK